MERIEVEPDPARALDRGLELIPTGGQVVLPTYTAMLALRDVAADRGLVRPYGNGRSPRSAPRCPAHTGCERLRGDPALLPGCASARTSAGRRARCVFTVTRSSDSPGVASSCFGLRAGARCGRRPGRSTSLLLLPIVGRSGGGRRARRSAVACPVCSIAQAVPGAARDSSRPSWSARSASVGAGRAGAHGWWGEPPASRTRPCGRCCGGRGSRDGRDRRASRPTVTSGLVPATCCTWTCPATRASCGQATASRATAPAGRPREGLSATTTCTRSSTTTPGSLTARSTPTSKLTPSSASSSEALPSWPTRASPSAE